MAGHRRPEGTTRQMEYSVRHSSRARHVWLKVLSTGELVVVLPRDHNEKHVPAIVERNRTWIERATNRVTSRCPAPPGENRATLPDAVVLQAVGESWSVSYCPTDSMRVVAREHAGRTVVLSGRAVDREACRDALLRWLQRKAKASLEPWLREIALEGGFTVDRVTVRSQRTRWASCSHQGSISLNLRLLFVAPEIARHVMLHELCHTVRMDHSAQFWALLEKHDREWRIHRREARVAWRGLPAWLDGPLRS